jgi:hypothetical protein|tara:strand:+ start:386 stop:643 length:258 start_codon:yes stop_codon:yes gene_type:complete
MKSVTKAVLNISLITLVYGIIYANLDKKHFNFKSIIDPYYFSFTTVSSVGYGDITPQTDKAKLLVMTQQILMISEVVETLKIFNV